MADIKAALAHARLVAKTAGNTGNTRNTENNSSDIMPLGAIELAATNQERLATPATQAGSGLLPMLPLAKSGNVEVATEKTHVKQQLSAPVTTVASVAANFGAVPQFSKIIKATRPRGYSDREWEAALADAAGLGYPPDGRPQ
jgi:hypothetical protein